MRRHFRPGFTMLEVLTAITVVVLIGGVVGALFVASTRIWERCSTQAKAFPSGYIALSRIANDIRNAGNIYIKKLDPEPTRWEIGTEYAVGDYVTDSDGLIFRCIAAHTAAKEPRKSPLEWAPLRSSYIALYPARHATDPVSGDFTALTFDAGGVTKTVTPNQIPLEVDTTNARVYYLSDDSGDFGKSSGDILWCMHFDQDYDTGAVTEQRREIVSRNVESLAFKMDRFTKDSNNRPVWISSLTLEVSGTVDGKEDNSRYRKYTSKFSTGIVFKNPSIENLPAEPVFQN